MAKMSRDKISQIRGMLAELPQKPDEERLVTSKEVIFALKEDLQKKLADGYTVAELVEILAKQGVKVKPATLVTYLRTAPEDATG